MPRYRPARQRPRPAASARGAVPCLILLLAAFALIGLLFYFVMQS